MKKNLLSIALMLLLSLSMAITKLQAQKLSAIVSTDWLAENIEMPGMVILDVRETEDYAAGHIAGSVNFPAFPNWYINNPGEQTPWMEVPEDEKLFATLGKAGINTNSIVVVIARTADSEKGELGAYGMTKASRAAITLIYAGIEKVIFLNGGFDKWNAEGKPVSTQTVIPQATTYDGTVIETMFITKEYVEKKLGEATIVDTRDCDTYFGLGTDYSSSRAGHIPTAKVLPAPWFWQSAKTENGEITYLEWKDTEKIKEIALGVLGEDLSVEIIDYCGVGGYASPVWFLLTQVVGYTNVKFYDGSMQEWTSDPEAAVVSYKCE